jgi:choline dehydrogenase-like flavoprotein
MTEPLDCDVVIVGAGIAGALVAWKLGSQGVKVIVLESGPGNQNLAQRQSYVDNFKTSGAPYPIRPAAPKNYDFFTNATNYYQEQPTARPAQGPMTASPTDPSQPGYDPFGDYAIISNDIVTKGDWFQSNYERQMGGATWHWLGTSLRLLPNDFQLKTQWNPNSGDGLTAYDWPFTYQDIEPWYGLAEQTIGVSGPDQGETPAPNMTRSSGYPMPGIPQSYLDQQMIAATQGQTFFDLGTKENYPLQVAPTPQARNSVPGYGGRPQCQGSSSCIPICPIQAKYDATQHIQLAQQTGNVEFRVQSVAYQVVADTTNPNLPITRILYKTWQADANGNINSTPGQVTGKIFVLAAHAIENAKLLLNSPCGQMTVANSSTQVGQNLADHPVSLVYALTDNPVYGYRGPLSTSGVESLRDGDFRSYRGAFRMEIGNDGWSWPISDPYTTPMNLLGAAPTSTTPGSGIWGQDLAKQVANTLSRQIRIGCLAEQLPDPSFRVQLSSTAMDALGIPMPVLTYGVGAYGRRALSAAVAASVQIFKTMIKNPVIQWNYEEFTDANGTIVVDQARTGNPVVTPNIFIREGWAGAGHVMGTHRMGTDPMTSVTDGTQRTHDHPNLFLLGSGNWPSYATGNPTLTISALALWAADTIKKQLSP